MESRVGSLVRMVASMCLERAGAGFDRYDTLYEVWTGVAQLPAERTGLRVRDQYHGTGDAVE